MPDFTQSLNDALKYHQEAERQAFEHAIDQNPLESTHHLVYADWLDEHGEPEEAAFRRAMGEWHQEVPDNFSKRPPLMPGDYWHVSPEGFTKFARNNDSILNQVGDGTTKFSHFTDRFRWNSYRDMESAFRKAFQAGQHTS